MKSVLISILATAAVASPTLKQRSTFCDQWGSEKTGSYTIYNNLWGKDDAESGEQCTTNNGFVDGSTDTISWSTEWSWSGGPYNVKSYANVVLDSDYVAISSISSMPSKWSWTYTGDDIVANVAYDIFTGSVPSSEFSDHDYEFMIWLAALGGAGPISSTGSPVATVDLAGVTWQLYQGPNGNMEVFSFVPSANVESFDGDLTEFVGYLVENHGVSGDQLLQGVGAGTEPFLGSNAVFTTSGYSLSIV